MAIRFRLVGSTTNCYLCESGGGIPHRVTLSSMSIKANSSITSLSIMDNSQSHANEVSESVHSELCLAFKICTKIENMPAQILHSPKWPNYLQKNQHDIKIYSPVQDNDFVGGLAIQLVGYAASIFAPMVSKKPGITRAQAALVSSLAGGSGLPTIRIPSFQLSPDI